MQEDSFTSVSIGLLLPFDYNLYQVAIILEVFTRTNQWCLEHGTSATFEVNILQTQGQINEYSNSFFHYPVENTLTEKIFDYIIIPPFNTTDISEIIDKNKVFKDWIVDQYQNGSRVLAIGNGIALCTYSGLLDDQKISLAGLSTEYFKYFNKVQEGNGDYIQRLDNIILCSGSIRIFYLLFEIIVPYADKEMVVQLAKHFQVDLNWKENRHYSDFEFVYETQDEQIDLVLEKIHTQYFSIKTLNDVLDEYQDSRRNFNRKFIEQVRMTPIEYLQNVRISYAKHFLESTNESIEEIARQVGYEDPKSFRVIFSRITGIQPLDYRKRFLWM